MKNRILSFVYLLVFSTANLFSLVVNAPDLDVVDQWLHGIDEQTLVVWDVDFTLIVPTDALLTPAGEDYLNKFNQKYAAAEHKNLHEDRVSRAVSQRNVRLVEDKVLTLMQKLKEKKVKMIALTAIRSGQFGVIQNVEEWRVQELRDLGIDFSHSFPADKIVFTEFTGKKSPPVFVKGVLSSDNYCKGEVLAAFLKRVNFKPSKILFVDDRLKYITAVEQQFDARVPTISFHYTAAAEQSTAFDESVAEFQLAHLVQHGQWLSDQEVRARLLLKNTNPHGTFIQSGL